MVEHTAKDRLEGKVDLLGVGGGADAVDDEWVIELPQYRALAGDKWALLLHQQLRNATAISGYHRPCAHRTCR
eukprot:COSAG05_NODE_6797_length_901_cov_4.895000_1_plen_73_part_00